LIGAPFHASDRVRMALERLETVAAFYVPKTYFARTREEAALVFAPRQILNVIIVNLDHPNTGPRLDIPNAHGPIPGPRNGAPAIRCQQGVIGPIGVSFEYLQALTRLKVPYPHAAIVAIARSRDGASCVGAELHRTYESGMPFQNTEAFSR